MEHNANTDSAAQPETTAAPSGITQPFPASTGGETTTIVHTPTAGTIHGTHIEAFRIIAGSTFPSNTDDPLIRIAPGDTDDAYDFTTGIEPDTISLYDDTNPDVIIRGVYEDFFPHGDDGMEVNTRVFFQTSSDTGSVFSELNNTARNDDDIPGYTTEFVTVSIKGWTILESWTDYILDELLTDDTAIVARQSTIQTLFDPHPEHTVQDTGKYIITDDAQVDPDYYETENPRPGTGHGNGGNPHDVYYFLEHGECPADGCDAEFDTWRSLRSHVGGKATPNDTPEENEHDQLNLRLNEVTVEATTNNE